MGGDVPVASAKKSYVPESASGTNRAGAWAGPPGNTSAHVAAPEKICAAWSTVMSVAQVFCGWTMTARRSEPNCTPRGSTPWHSPSTSPPAPMPAGSQSTFS